MRKPLGRVVTPLSMALAALVVLLVLDYVFTPWLNRGPVADWPWYRQRVNHVATLLGNGGVCTALGLAVWLIGYGAQSRRWQVAGRWVVLNVLLAGFWSQVIKLLVGRPRPRVLVYDHEWLPSGPAFRPSWESFPSGHAMTSFAVYGLLALICPRWRVPLLGICVFVSLGRVYGGAHFPSDVLAGGLLGWVLARYAAGRWRGEVGHAA